MVACGLVAGGCALRGLDAPIELESGDHYEALAGSIEYPDAVAGAGESPLALRPLSLDAGQPPPTWPLSLEEATQLALDHSRVLRELGGVVLRFPESVGTVYSPAIRTTDPQAGVEAALSQFDAQLGTSLFFANNDRALNNLVAQGTRLFKQDVNIYRTEIFKQSVAGTRFALRHNTDYDSNNAPTNLFPSAWNTDFEAEFRQPLLQGAGVRFNRLAGPDSGPGVIRGVMIARLNTSVSLAEFETSLRNLLSNVENAYWDLYFAYRDLDAKKAARDASLETWRVIKTRQQTGRRGGEAEKEAQAREQYFRLHEEVQNALAGRLLQRTRTFNGSSGGTFRGVSGVQAAERRLRLAMGIAINDGRLIRPSDEPVMAEVVFDWDEIVAESLARRAELRRQRDRIRQAELELAANRNFLLPRLDTVGLYRWRGFGHNLINASRDGKAPFDNAYMNLTTGDFQEWELGVEFSLPIGFRKAHAAVRNAQLKVAQRRAILEEQERQVLYGLSNALAEVERALAVSRTAYNRLAAAQQELDAAQAAFEADRVPVDLVLDAQQRLADATNRFYRARVEYALAVKNVHFEKGTLLDYNGVFLTEGPRICGSACRTSLPSRIDYTMPDTVALRIEDHRSPPIFPEPPLPTPGDSQ